MSLRLDMTPRPKPRLFLDADGFHVMSDVDVSGMTGQEIAIYVGAALMAAELKAPDGVPWKVEEWITK